MCGIAGYFVQHPDHIRPQAVQALAGNLLRQIESRGRDATGYAFVSRKDNKKTHLCKAPIRASDFLKVEGHLLTKPTVSAMPRSMILHTRYATQGSPMDNRNNHPIYSKESGLCMVHNGWFIDDFATIEQFKLKKDAEVDTETYLRLIEKFYVQGETKTVESGIQQATQNVWGSLACAMVQGGKPEVMWLWRDQGQLSLALTDWGYVFASTKDALLHALYESCRSIDLAWYELLEVPRQTLLVFQEGSSEAKVYDLPAPEWDTAPNNVNTKVVRYSVNGEQVVRRSRGGTTTHRSYIFDDDDYGWEGYYGGHYRRVDDKSSQTKSTGTYQSSLPGVSSGGAHQADGSTPADANTDRNEAARAEGHDDACYCDACFSARKKAHGAGKACKWTYCSVCNSGTDGFID